MSYRQMHAAAVLITTALMTIVGTAAAGGTLAILAKCDASQQSQQWQRGTVGQEIVNTAAGITSCLDVIVRWTGWVAGE